MVSATDSNPRFSKSLLKTLKSTNQKIYKIN